MIESNVMVCEADWKDEIRKEVQEGGIRGRVEVGEMGKESEAKQNQAENFQIVAWRSVKK